MILKEWREEPMGNNILNVVYIGRPSFPIGYATTKRRRYMVDYMNNHGIQSFYLVCDFKQSNMQNPKKGNYGICEYRDISYLAASKKYIKFWRLGCAYLRRWYVQGRQNVLIFTTILSVFEYPFYLYARKIGYKIVFDQVETSYLQNENSFSLLRQVNIRLSEWLSKMAYPHSASIVISRNLWNEVHSKYPQRPLCLLPNSTPQFCKIPKKEFSSPLKILYAGTFSPKDGVDYLIEGIVKAYDAGANIELILLGKGARKDMEVLERVKEKKYIHYLGFVSDDDLVRHLTESDVLCMTRCNSRFANYGFPFKLSEYLATGNVVLATNVGDICEYIGDKESAYIVPPEDSHAIAQVIQHIETCPQEALQVAEGGLKVMQQHFSIEVVGKKFVEFLEEL